MHKSPSLLRGTISVTLLSLLLRAIALFSQSRITGLIGAEGVGLLQLALSVQGLAVTLATSGIRYSVTRLLAEELGLGRQGCLRSVLRCCCRYALCFSIPAALLLFLLAVPLAGFAGDDRIALSLRCLALGLPFLALNAVLGGYFTALGCPWKASVVQVVEQLSMTILTLLLLPLTKKSGLDAACASIGLSAALSDLLSLLLSLLLFWIDIRQRPRSGSAAPNLRRRLLRLSLPLALSSYARTALSTLQHLLVPKALRRGGIGAAKALEIYGTVGGMVFPVLGFASVFFLALAELMIPDLTQAQMRQEQELLERTANRALSICLLCSASIALLLYLLGPALGQALYHNAEAGEYIRVLSPLVLFMYLDHVTDGMLKGLGLQLDSMYINIVDAGCTLLAVWFLLPRYGAAAYIGILYVSECGNFLASFLRLRRMLRIKLL